MVRLLTVVLLVGLLLFSCGCSGFFAFSGAINPGMQSASGLVTLVHLSITDSGSSITVVTLVGGGAASTINFCGDQTTQFPMNQLVQANFNPGTPCATLIVVILG